MSKLLFDEQPIVIGRELAKLIGLNEAIVLQQLHYWLEINRKANKNFHDGRYWTYNTMKNWHENDFSFWSHDTVKRTFSSLAKKGYLLSGNYNRQKFDQTKWYTIDYEALEALKTFNSAKCPNVLECPETAESPNSAKCPIGTVQNAPLEQCKMPQPIPEINTETSSENILSYPIGSVLTEESKKEKTDMIRCDKTPNQSVMEKQKNKESFQNATVTSDKHLFKPSAPKYSVTDVEETIKKNIDYDYILMDDPHCKEMLDGVLHVIVSTIMTDFKNDSIGMGDERVPAELVKSVFFKLTREDIEYFIENFNRQTDPTIKLSPYIRTSLYRNYGTNNFYWTNRVHIDMPHMAEKNLKKKTIE